MLINAERLTYIPILTQRDAMARYIQNEFLEMVIDTYMGFYPRVGYVLLATHTCNFLTRLALTENPELSVTARTLMVESASTSILRKNGFACIGIVNDPEDGDVWEWMYQPERR